jgi:type I restriction enzyme S subunit
MSGAGHDGLPPGWIKAPLGSVVEILDSRRIPLNSDQRAVRPGPYPYYGANGQAGVIDDYLFDGDYALLAEDGGYFDDRKRGVAYRATGRFWVNNHAHIVGPLGGMETQFLVFAFNNLDWMAYVSGTTRLKLTQGKMAEAPLLVPPLNEQKRIVAKIEALQARSDAAKEALDAIPPLLEKFRQSVLAAAFRGDLTKKWREAHPDVEAASKLLERIRAERRRKWEEANPKKKYVEPEPVDTEGLPELPAGWCWASVDEFTTKVADGVHQKPTYVESGIPFVTVKNLTAGPGISFDDVNYITPSDHAEFIRRTHPERGDVLISKDGTLGVVRHIDTERVFSIFVSVAVMKPVVRETGHHLALMLQTPQVQRLLVATGSGLKHIHLRDLRVTPIPIPPLVEQAVIIEQVADQMKRQDSVLAALHGSYRLSATLNQSILAKAFRGELVPQDPNDEPASVLLERIRHERDEQQSLQVRSRRHVPR